MDNLVWKLLKDGSERFQYEPLDLSSGRGFLGVVFMNEFGNFIAREFNQNGDIDTKHISRISAKAALLSRICRKRIEEPKQVYATFVNRIDNILGK